MYDAVPNLAIDSLSLAMVASHWARMVGGTTPAISRRAETMVLPRSSRSAVTVLTCMPIRSCWKAFQLSLE